MTIAARWLRAVLTGTALFALAGGARADALPEYRLKTAFIYNFMVYTEWPAETGPALNLCIVGADPFGKEIDGLQGKVAAGRSLAVHRKAAGDPLKACQAVFIAGAGPGLIAQVLEGLRGQPVLTIADTPGATQRGVALNMNLNQQKITFQVNLLAARAAGLTLSSKLLRLATEVQQ